MTGKEYRDEVIKQTERARTLRETMKAPHADCVVPKWGECMEKCWIASASYFGNGQTEELKRAVHLAVAEAMQPIVKAAADAAVTAAEKVAEKALSAANLVKGKKEHTGSWKKQVALRAWDMFAEHPYTFGFRAALLILVVRVWSKVGDIDALLGILRIFGGAT